VRVRYADLAADEIEEILAYLRERSPQAADGFLRQLGQIERMLGQFPWAGTVTRHEWLRRMPVRQYPILDFL
jgi:plasmid stabilization system protein ParE